ncbi:cytochrome b/b6 domain-containing protein [Ramlibacter tataouinensis]|uniref:cytochrome b/b6 domain-containing protein n=1 Tax=Ramlibacter tataouinensis TaxID=94132 RepID=UPI0022F3B4BC|nr:cytochrome b/b6 domain-containing protein [Ramlibacter tataouinensis]WBY00359.1 cytochrome b/b6 domain-containing protein [Ramlibacter tataouinensis]
MTSTSPSLAAATAARPPAASRRAVDAPTRMFHWLFALSFAGAWLTGDAERWRALHVVLGYTMAGLLAFRIVYGLVGPRQARLSLTFRRLGGSLRWLRGAVASRLSGVDWRRGQNLLTPLAIVGMLALVVPVTLSGYATFHEWADGEWLEEIHEFFANALLWVVLAHLALLAVLSLLRRQNQALPMLTGRLPGRGPDLVQQNRVGLALLVLAAVLAYGSWEWQQAPHGLLPSKALRGGDHRKRRQGDDDRARAPTPVQPAPVRSILV